MRPSDDPVRLAVENGTVTGMQSFDLRFVCMIFSHPLSCLPSLTPGLVPGGQHDDEGSDSSAELRRPAARRGLPAYLD